MSGNYFAAYILLFISLILRVSGDVSKDNDITAIHGDKSFRYDFNNGIPEGLSTVDCGRKLIGTSDWGTIIKIPSSEDAVVEDDPTYAYMMNVKGFACVTLNVPFHNEANDSNNATLKITTIYKVISNNYREEVTIQMSIKAGSNIVVQYFNNEHLNEWENIENSIDANGYVDNIQITYKAYSKNIKLLIRSVDMMYNVHKKRGKRNAMPVTRYKITENDRTTTEGPLILSTKTDTINSVDEANPFSTETINSADPIAYTTEEIAINSIESEATTITTEKTTTTGSTTTSTEGTTITSTGEPTTTSTEGTTTTSTEPTTTTEGTTISSTEGTTTTSTEGTTTTSTEPTTTTEGTTISSIEETTTTSSKSTTTTKGTTTTPTTTTTVLTTLIPPRPSSTWSIHSSNSLIVFFISMLILFI